ncbi:hypothetical protein N7468_000255 [Penicillium chermesinum]|uniref:Protein-S-isoprenylcysteine O-methyltransferase n=1 Tax=Penicillium chermesinum TaxID=63820 RepID=A0A9W9PL96_9EURO|nr:uncharacterized protein N7468_000255 [Penicillium chermesinum]KAJ5248804.1 hypothetical protein N7468_000255 [Penicillium chermesinum]KAJ6150906.1 hypothetical protein N7470_007500 [Penicillium chermesinum]
MTFETPAFIAANVAAAYLFAWCTTPPNSTAPPKEHTVKDRLHIFVGRFPTIVRTGVTAVILYHTLVAGLTVYAPARVGQACPRAQNCNAALFTWSPTTILSLLSIYAGAAVRLSAYGGLGRSFTFHLAAPERLVTSGVYAWIQHPSYTGLWLIGLGLEGFHLRWDGVMACLVPEGVYAMLSGWGLTLLAGILAVEGFLTTARLGDEEEMLHEQFGEEWEAWHGKTARFVPFLF